jgi:hypothetical protein
MSAPGWKQLLEGWPWFRGKDRFPMPAYSEFMPPPFVVRKPYGGWDPLLLRDDDPWGWPITEYEEALSLRPGLERIGGQLLDQLVRLAAGDRSGHHVPQSKVRDNPCWPDDLAAQAANLAHERYVLLLPLALSRTLDDKGRVRWTLFGGSEQGPARPFWRGLFTGPDREAPEEQGLAFFRGLLHTVYGEPEERPHDLRAAGLRVLPLDDAQPCPWWSEGPLPSWVTPLLWERGQSLRGVKYLLTFRPFARLPAPVRRAYLAGELHLLPCPGSLLFWWVPGFDRLQKELPFVMQVPLLQQVERHEGPHGLRVPQAGWMHEPRTDDFTPPEDHGLLRGTYKRTQRPSRVRRDEDPLETAEEDKLAQVLFSAAQADVDLYNKPMAHNVHLWARDYRLLLDGPRADQKAVARASEAVAEGGLFGYRFLFPAMRVGLHELYWHRPLVAYRSPQDGKAALLPDGPAGYFTAYRAEEPDLARPLELWPRFLCRNVHAANVELFSHTVYEKPRYTLLNIRKLLDTSELLGGRPLPRGLARALLTADKRMTLDGWLDALPEKARDRERARWLVDEVQKRLEPPARPKGKARPPAALTFDHTSRRSFEVVYWNTIAFLSAGDYVNKNNADPVRDPATEAQRPQERRDLDPLGTYLLDHYARLIKGKRMTGKALAGEMPFRWQTEFRYPWMGGWLDDHEGKLHERNLVVVIPGRDRGRAVLMADHYDTAFMEDWYNPEDGGTGARLAAPGADDNGSATATLMLAAPIYLEMSRRRQLGCDIWLVHLTGEEYPADGLGARQLCRHLVEGGLHLKLADGSTHDLSHVALKGALIMDMIAHNSNADRDVFQISPGTTRESMWLACQAQRACAAWNAWAAVWNQKAARRACTRGRRVRGGTKPPPMARHLQLHGEVRPPYDPRSTLYNTDGDELSDIGAPVVLIMENYDIDRVGYHDTKDTMANINLDYGAALSAIAIEAVARMATEEMTP